MFFSIFCDNVFAKDTPSNSKPKVTYGSKGEFSSYEYNGPWPANRWSHTGGAYKYHSWDKDTFVAINANSNVTLSSQSTSTYSIGGSTKFNFGKVAELNLEGSVGETWGKTSTVNFKAAKGYTYELWSANKIHVQKYTYPKKALVGNKITYHKAQALNKDGTIKWFFRYKK